MDTEKRSKSIGTARQEGVGARQDTLTFPPQGGGYLEIYRFRELEKQIAAEKNDPRLNILREIGLSKTLQTVAAEIGVDNFLKMWQILDSDDSLRNESGGILLRMRSFKSYRRRLRNQHLMLLRKKSIPVAEISNRACHTLGENIKPGLVRQVFTRSK